MDTSMHNGMEDEVLKSFVDEYYTKTIDGIYFAHQPIYGYRSPYADTSQIARYMITRSILDQLARYSFHQLIDISAAEGYTAHLIRTLFHTEVEVTDWSESVCAVARAVYGLKTQVADILALPFEDDAFEVVLCSETLEHIPGWEKGFDELLRITKNLLVVTVPHDPIEFVEYNRQHVLGGHINYFEEETFDFLKERNLSFTIEKTLCPKLIKPRVLAEAYPKPPTSVAYRMYNACTPLLKTIFGKRTAQWLIDQDTNWVQRSGTYGGITLVIEKQPLPRNPKYKPVRARDFMDIVVPHYYPGKQQPL